MDGIESMKTVWKAPFLPSSKQMRHSMNCSLISKDMLITSSFKTVSTTTIVP